MIATHTDKEIGVSADNLSNLAYPEPPRSYTWQVPAKPIASKSDLPGLAIELAVDILEEPLALLIQWIASFFRDK